MVFQQPLDVKLDTENDIDNADDISSNIDELSYDEEESGLQVYPKKNKHTNDEEEVEVEVDDENNDIQSGGGDEDDDYSENEEDKETEEENIIDNKEKKTNKVNIIDPSEFIENNDDDDDESDEVDENYLMKFDKEIRKNYLLDFHPETVINNYEEIQALVNIRRNNQGLIIDDFHKTLPFLTKYEKTRILGQRAKQINAGTKPYLDKSKLIVNGKPIIDGYLIALKELEHKLIPFIIRRPLPNGGSEYWKLEDLEVIN